jgi:hypothetical protein
MLLLIADFLLSLLQKDVFPSFSLHSPRFNECLAISMLRINWLLIANRHEEGRPSQILNISRDKSKNCKTIWNWSLETKTHGKLIPLCWYDSITYCLETHRPIQVLVPVCITPNHLVNSL